MTRGVVFNLAHYAVHDGPGIRTTIFLKGCPLRCAWCCSPQSQLFEPERTQTNGKIYGREVDAEELFAEVMRDAPFWRRSHGGVTLSGGEVLSQPDFAVEFLGLCRANNVHTAIETSLFASPEVFKRVADAVDFIIFDLKAMDGQLHKKLTGQDNEAILRNAAWLLQSGKECLARFPMVPGVNDSEEELRALGAFVEKHRERADLEILKYHRLGVGIYEELGRSYALPDVQPPTDAEVAGAKEILSGYRINVF
ncbi:MAG: glycyl-radical enzyme activating protein [Synergistes sp.]|nr:glycyl-radical enzyme activating protein [Synergistes sp.]